MIARSLRTRLFEDTKAAHDRTDRLVSGFDLSCARGRAGFFTAQRLALDAMARVPGIPDDIAACLGDLVARLDADLGAPPRGGLPAVRHVEPLAARYILLGSRIGTQVLARRFAAADPGGSSAYFDAPSAKVEWRQLCLALQKLSGRGTMADAVVADAIRLFDLFSAAAEIALVSEVESSVA